MSGIWSELSQRIARLDPTLGPTAELAAAASVKQFDFIEKKITQAAKKRDEVLRGQVGRLTAQLFPRGGLQERTLNVVPFLARYGMRLLEEQVRADRRARAPPSLHGDPAVSGLDILAFGAHPDDVELGAGGTLLKAAGQALPSASSPSPAARWARAGPWRAGPPSSTRQRGSWGLPTTG